MGSMSMFPRSCFYVQYSVNIKPLIVFGSNLIYFKLKYFINIFQFFIGTRPQYSNINSTILTLNPYPFDNFPQV